ncbi:MAG: hypothetical protein ACE5HP_10070 [Gemmatimonadota bacterium]
MSFWFAIIAIVVVVTCGEVLTKAIEGFSRRPSPPPVAGEEIQRLREQVELLSKRVDRLSEDQKFLTRLLEERPRLPDHGQREEANEW